MKRLAYVVAVVVASACGHGGASVDGGAPDLAAGGSGVGGVGAGDLGARDLAPAAPSTAFVYVSGYSTTIGRYTLDPVTGALTSTGTTTATGSPSFLAVDPARRRLYAVDEANSKVEAFAIDAATGALTHIGSDAASGGSGPAHLAVDGSGKWVLVANYGSGDVGILPIASDGSVAAGTSLHAGANAHEVVVDATNRFAWVPCLGSNYVAQFRFDAAAGTLAAQAPPTVPTPAASGPRHLALHPSRALAYLIEETDSMLAAYAVDAGGKLTLLQRQTTRAAGATGTNTGAEVQVHPSGNFVYVSNRGDDDLGVFAVGSDGTLTPIAHTKTGGQTPRHFSIDPTGHWLLVANQTSGDVRVFSIDTVAGTLTPAGAPVSATMPSFVGVVPLP
ncbi:MAG TPA: lactonase family protein [Polyangia bacterium]|nr:lactonase family protein [Polyangia bacterium]